MATLLKEIDKTLVKHPYFKYLTEKQRIQVYNNAYQHYFANKQVELLTYWDTDLPNVNHYYSDGNKNVYIDEHFDPYVDYIHILLNKIFKSTPLPIAPNPPNTLSTYSILEESHIQILNELTFEQKRLVYHIAIGKIKELRKSYYQVESRIGGALLVSENEAVAELNTGFEVEESIKEVFNSFADLTTGFTVRIPEVNSFDVNAGLNIGFELREATHYNFNAEAELNSGIVPPMVIEENIYADIGKGYE